MKFARYLAHGQISYGVVDGDTLREITTSPFEDFEITDHTHTLGEVKLLVPALPTKILAVGQNYASHLRDRPTPTEPMIFLKTPSSLLDPGEPIVRPDGLETFEEEGELVAVIKRRCKNVSKEDALGFVLGYTCGNDVSARDWQRADRHWWRAKSADTFAPAGPFIADDIDPGAAMLRIRVNGEEVRADSMGTMIFDVPTVISFVSRAMTLEPGDMIYTGTFGKPSQLNPGDTVEVEIDGIGVLSNPVIGE